MKTEVIEKPMLFSAPMVRAILEGRKTQTRRVVKRQPPKTHQCLLMCDEVAEIAFSDKPEPPASVWPSLDCGIKIPHPVGSRIVMLTTWSAPKEYDKVKPSQLPRDVQVWSLFDGTPKPDWCGRNRPGRFMPKWMRSRMPQGIITDLRVERLQDITPQDAIAEGIERINDLPMDPNDFTACWRNYDEAEAAPYWNSPIDSFRSLWVSINGRDSLKENPFVWVYTFKHLSPEATG